MTRFRIPIAQPPNATRNRVRNGRNQWLRKLRANSHVHAGWSEKSYAPETGNQPSLNASTYARTSASHMYGVALRMYAAGITVLSSDFRRAASAPTRLPAI